MRTAGTVACALACLLLAGGCSGDTKKDGHSKDKKDGSVKDTVKGSKDTKDTAKDTARGSFEGSKDSVKDTARDPGPVAESRAAKREQARVGGVTAPAGGKRDPKSGILTAGSFDDNLDPGPYRSFLKKFGQDDAVRGLPGRFLGPRLVLTVKDGVGAPVGNACVRITSTAGGPAVELVSRTDGRVVFLPSWDQVATGAGFEVVV